MQQAKWINKYVIGFGDAVDLLPLIVLFIVQMCGDRIQSIRKSEPFQLFGFYLQIKDRTRITRAIHNLFK